MPVELIRSDIHLQHHASFRWCFKWLRPMWQAIYKPYRTKLCKHEHTPYRGEMPCTGPLICTMCGALFDSETKQEIHKWRLPHAPI